MEFSWSTFFVEIVNFGILVWLLKRFLYQPVVRAIDARERAIADETEAASAAKKEGEELARRYEERLDDWEREKGALREGFERELADERIRREAQMQASLEDERRNFAAAQQAREREISQRLQEQAAENAARFGAQLLARIASPEVEQRLIAVCIEDLQGLAPEGREAIARAFGNGAEVKVVTRFPVDGAQRAELGEAVAECLGRRPSLVFAQDETLVAGVRIDLGTTALEANVERELRWFAEAEGHAAGR